MMYTPTPPPPPQPTHPQRPPPRRIPPQTAPVQHQVRREGTSGRQCREEQQRCDAQVVEELQRRYLREDAQGGEGLCGGWWAVRAAGHVFRILIAVWRSMDGWELVGEQRCCYRGGIVVEGVAGSALFRS